jgi:hypothetical protein
MLYKSYTPQDSAYILSIWEPHVRLPPTHTLAEGILARDRICPMLKMECPIPEHASGDAHALNDLVTEAIPMETFILCTYVTL